jgi:dihydrolipoamide dehydrogenase
VHEALAARGVDVHTGSPAVAVERNGTVRLTLEDGTTLEGDEILVAVGRRPATRELGLETVGLEPGKSVEVDERLRARGHDWLYAIGDANGRVLLTHMGKYQGRIAADAILGRDARIGPRSDGPLSPRVIFTEPQVAAVGHTLGSAQQAGIGARAVDVETSSTAGGSFYGRDTPGTCRIVVDEQRRVIVGATFCGVDVGEWLHAATIAVVAEVPLETLWHAVPSFPTRSEIWLRLLETYGL